MRKRYLLSVLVLLGIAAIINLDPTLFGDIITFIVENL